MFWLHFWRASVYSQRYKRVAWLEKPENFIRSSLVTLTYVPYLSKRHFCPFFCRNVELPAGGATEALRRWKQWHQCPRWTHLRLQLRWAPRHHRENNRVMPVDQMKELWIENKQRTKWHRRGNLGSRQFTHRCFLRPDIELFTAVTVHYSQSSVQGLPFCKQHILFCWSQTCSDSRGREQGALKSLQVPK